MLTSSIYHQCASSSFLPLAYHLICTYFILSYTSAVCAYPSIPLYYHHYNNMTAELKQVHEDYPELTNLYSIGKSILGKELWVLELTADSDSIGIPYVKLVGNIHGNEPLGKELLIHLAKYLLAQYVDGDEEAQYILKTTRLYLLPSMNPDGFETSTEGTCRLGIGRGNANGVDLNRNFPESEFIRRNQEQPETIAVRKWIASKPFLLSASLHGGALLANYPFDTYRHHAGRRFTRELGEAAETDDDDVFRHLALVYSESHPDMHRGISCKAPHHQVFNKGITNGAAWYPVSGGMQDYNYLYHGCMELTLEIGCCKYPSAELLPSAWNDNLKSMLKFIQEAQRGVFGQVLDYHTGTPISNAKVKISGRNMTFVTAERGEYWRILLPGYYFLETSADGYATNHVRIVIPTTQYSGNLKPLRQDITLQYVSDTYKDSTTEDYYSSNDMSTFNYAFTVEDISAPPFHSEHFRSNESFKSEYMALSQSKPNHISIKLILSLSLFIALL